MQVVRRDDPPSQLRSQPAGASCPEPAVDMDAQVRNAGAPSRSCDPPDSGQPAERAPFYAVRRRVGGGHPGMPARAEPGFEATTRSAGSGGIALFLLAHRSPDASPAR